MDGKNDEAVEVLCRDCGRYDGKGRCGGNGERMRKADMPVSYCDMFEPCSDRVAVVVNQGRNKAR